MIRRRHLPLTILLLGGLPLPGIAMDEHFLDGAELPTVLSATRLKQAPSQIPGSMTVLDRELIQASGARDIPELMRLVPGMMVGYLRGHTANVNYHGTNTTEARRMQVLVDGRSVYRPGLATVDWTNIPLAIEDIERIEVFRGPNTAAYGANALMGVINIVSSQPLMSQGTRLKLTQGNRGVSDLYARHGFQAGNSTLRISLFGKQDDGFDQLEDGSPYRDSRRLNGFNLFGNTELNANQSLSWQAGFKEGTNQRDNDYTEMAEPTDDSFMFDRLMREQGDNSDIRARDYYIQAHWKNELSPTHLFELKAYAQHMERLTSQRACDSPVVFSPEMRQLYLLGNVYPRRVNYILRNRPRSDGNWGDPAFYSDFLVNRDRLPAEYLPLVDSIVAQHAIARNGAPTCFDLNENLRETRYEIEAQSTLQLTEQLRGVFGSNLRLDQTKSQTFFGGKVENSIVQLFGNLEYQPHARWMLHAGAMAEEDQLSGFSVSPRLAVHYFLHPSHSLRAVHSRAVRSPDMYENNAYWSYTPSGLSGAPVTGDTYYAIAQAPGNLKQERMRSSELGYNGHFHQLGVAVDFKLFHDEIHDMISQPLQIVNFVPDNSSFARFTGAETQVDWSVGRRDRLRATYAYVDFTASHPLDQRLTARNSGSLAWLRQWPGKISSSLLYYGADQLNERRFERLDMRLAKTFKISGSSQLELALTWQHRLDNQGTTWPENLYDSNNHYYLSADVNF